MSEFQDFMTMKLIAQRRFEKHGMSDELRLPLMEAGKVVKNLNVRVPVHVVAEIETLAEWLDITKAELVLEILESALKDARALIEHEGTLEAFQTANWKRLEDEYGAVIERGPDGKVQRVRFSPQDEDGRAT